MRHPGLATLWFLSLVLSVIGLMSPMLFSLPVTPVLAIVTADAVARRRDAERQSTLCGGIHRVVMMLLVAASAIGIVTLAVSPLDLSILTAVPAMALVFLSTLVLAIRALTVKSPFRASIPAIVAHVPMALVMIQAVVLPGRDHAGGVSFGLGIYPWGAVLVLSTLASIVSVVGFDGVTDGVPSARVRS
jgi:hypothetical protein